MLKLVFIVKTKLKLPGCWYLLMYMGKVKGASANKWHLPFMLTPKKRQELWREHWRKQYSRSDFEIVSIVAAKFLFWAWIFGSKESAATKTIFIEAYASAISDLEINSCTRNPSATRFILSFFFAKLKPFRFCLFNETQLNSPHVINCMLI